MLTHLAKAISIVPKRIPVVLASLNLDYGQRLLLEFIICHNVVKQGYFLIQDSLVLFLFL
jgi:hypothetical protein